MTKDKALLILSVYVRGCATERRMAQMFGVRDGGLLVAQAAKELGVPLNLVMDAQAKMISVREGLYDMSERMAGIFFEELTGEDLPTWKVVLNDCLKKKGKKK